MEEDQKKDTAGKRNIMNKNKVTGMQDVHSGNTSNSICLKDKDRNKFGKKRAGQIAENFKLQTS